MESLVLEIRNPETVHAIAEAAKRQGTTPEAAALELLETALLHTETVCRDRRLAFPRVSPSPRLRVGS